MQPRLRENDWLLASADGVNIGVVPANYVRILGTRKAMKAESKCIPEDTIKSDLVSQKSSEAAPWQAPKKIKLSNNFKYIIFSMPPVKFNCFSYFS